MGKGRNITLFKLRKSVVSRLLAICFAAAVMCLSVTGCGKESNPSSASSVSSSVNESFNISAESLEESSKESSSDISSKEESSKIIEPTVEPVAKFSVLNVEKNSVTLKWTASSNASGYEIYRALNEDNNFEKIKTIKDNKTEEYTDNGVESGKLYYYRIRAFIFENDKYYYSSGTLTNAATTLSDVEGLYSSSQGAEEITIEWNVVSGASGYIISRKDENTDGEYNLIETLSDGDTTVYTDQSLTAASQYSYQVKPYKTVDGKRYYGGYATVDAWTVPKTPSVKLSYKDSKITATWSEAEGAEGYDVYMSTMEEGNYESVGSTTETEFTTDKVKNNNIYYIRVRGYYTINGEKKQGGYETASIICGNVPKVHGYDVGTTYIEISLDKQHMWYYKNGKLIVSTDVVTGYKNAHDTPTGLYYIINKSSPARLVGETWDVQVNYWLAVTYDGVGIHDSTWRYSGYGGNIYTYDGSHGCINTPHDEVKKIYDNCEENTPVVIY